MMRAPQRYEKMCHNLEASTAWRRKMRRMGLLLLGTLLLVLAGGAALASPAAADHLSQAAPVKISATNLECVPGEANLKSFTVRNLGKRTLTIDKRFGFRLFLFTVGPGGRELVGITVVAPAPGSEVIEPGTAERFFDLGVPMGPRDLSARRLLVEAEVFFVGREHPVRHLFSFPGCNAPQR
jgi:hypothetical protein